MKKINQEGKYVKVVITHLNTQLEEGGVTCAVGFNEFDFFFRI
jgi:hypothetical protein